MDWNDPYEVEELTLSKDEEILRWEFISSVDEGALSLDEFLGDDGFDDNYV